MNTATVAYGCAHLYSSGDGGVIAQDELVQSRLLGRTHASFPIFDGYVDEFAELLEGLLEQRQPVELHLSSRYGPRRRSLLACLLAPWSMDG